MSLLSLIRGGLGYIDIESEMPKQNSIKQLKSISGNLHNDIQWIKEYCAKNMSETQYNKFMVEYNEYYLKRYFL